MRRSRLRKAPFVARLQFNAAHSPYTDFTERNRKMPADRGFTLIELMITVAIVAILAAVALPSYSAYVQRANITDAVKGLSEMRLKMEQYFQDNRSWTPAAGIQPCQPGGGAPLPANTANFQFSCPVLGANTYSVAASGVGSMGAFSYTITESNVQATLGAPPGWLAPCANHWLLKKADSCS
jgi:type IV pilus assembly protein PilE